MKIRLFTITSILVMASLLLSGNALAQKHQGNKDFFGGPPSTAEKLARISENLNLSDQQEIAMLAVLHDKEIKREQLREQTHALMGPEICGLMIETESDILAILDADQAEQFMQMKEERRNRDNDKNRNRGRMGPPDCTGYEDSGS